MAIRENFSSPRLHRTLKLARSYTTFRRWQSTIATCRTWLAGKPVGAAS